MAWGKIDDRFHGHSKARRAGVAIALWTLALSWSCAELTDGHVPHDMPDLLIPGGSEMAAKLVAVGLWEVADGGYRFVPDDSLYRVVSDQADLDALRAAARRKHGAAVRERDSHKCVYCDAVEDLTLDHVVPLSRGGSNEVGNLVTACRTCNSSKGARVFS